MARQARQERGTGYYHVMLRGINRESLFRRDADKMYFMQLVVEQQMDNMLELMAWCVMDNHVHMLLKSEKKAMSNAVKIISIKYAAYYNQSLNRIGPVFGDRFRSENIEDEPYLLGVLRYIHRNPVKAGLVNDEVAYSWSSYGEYLNAPRFVALGQKAFVLELFGNDSNSFVSFHKYENDNEYLEIREDVERDKEAKVLNFIENFCKRNGVACVSEIKSHPDFFEEACRELVEGTGLSLRKAANYLETTHHKVNAALKGE